MKYRTYIYCQRCGKEYTTIKHKRIVPFCCKYCRSTMILVENYWPLGNGITYEEMLKLGLLNEDTL